MIILRDGLTFLAGLLVLALGAALIGPHFVDWNARRSQIEAQLSAATGANVLVGGAIELTLLPAPSLKLANLVVSEARPWAATNEKPLTNFLEAREARFEIAILALLQGDIRFTQAQFDNPEINLALRTDGTVQWPTLTSVAISEDGFVPKVAFERLVLNDGTLRLYDTLEQRVRLLSGISLKAEAASLSGPFKGEGEARLEGNGARFRFSTGVLEEGRLHLKAVMDETARYARSELDGTLLLGNATGQQSQGPVFEGNAIFSRRFGGLSKKNAVEGAPVPGWRASSQISLKNRQLSMQGMELKLGDESRSVALDGNAQIDFRQAPKALIFLTSKQIDLDRLLMADTARAEPPASTPVMPFDAQRLQRAINEVFAQPDPGAYLPIPSHIGYAVETLVLNGEIITSLAGEIDIGPGQPTHLVLAASSVSDTSLRLTGNVQTGTVPAFHGHASAQSADVMRLSRWLEPILPALAQALQRLPASGLGQTLAFDGDMDVSRSELKASSLILKPGGLILQGSLSLSSPEAGGRPVIMADFTMPSIDIKTLGEFASVKSGLADVDAKLALRAPLAGQAGQMALVVKMTQGNVTLHSFTLTQQDIQTLEAKGEWSTDTIKLNARVNAPDMVAISALAQAILPPANANALAAQAASFSPAKLDLKLEGPAQESFIPRTLMVTGVAGGTKISLDSHPLATDATVQDASLVLDSPEAAMLMRQLGIASQPPDQPTIRLGKGHVEIKVKGKNGTAMPMTMEAMIGATSLGFRGTLQLRPDAPELRGALKVDSPNAAPLIQALGLVPVYDQAGLAFRAEGDAGYAKGTWSGARLKGNLGQNKFLANLAFVPRSKAELDGVKGGLSGDISFDRLAVANLTNLLTGIPKALPVVFGPQIPASLWSDTPFSASLLEAFPVSLDIRTGVLELGDALPLASDGRMHLEAGPGNLTLSNATMTLGTGNVRGNLMLHRNGGTVSLSSQANVTNLTLERPSFQARLGTASLDITGLGDSPASLVASLTGTGNASLEDIRLPKTAPQALARVEALASAGTLSLTEADVIKVLGRELDRGSLLLPGGIYTMGINAGVLRLDNPKPVQTSKQAVVPPAGVAIKSALQADLKTMLVEQQVSIALANAPKDWVGAPPQITVRQRGPWAQPSREIDARDFFNSLAERAIGRDTAKIEALEADIRERAFFSRRMKGLQQMRQDILKDDLLKDDRLQGEQDLATQNVPQITPQAVPLAKEAAAQPIPVPAAILVSPNKDQVSPQTEGPVQSLPVKKKTGARVLPAKPSAKAAKPARQALETPQPALQPSLQRPVPRPRVWHIPFFDKPVATQP